MFSKIVLRNFMGCERQLIRKQFKRYYSKNLSEHQSNVMRKGLPVKKSIKNVNNIILVSSGKGGVGKSTVAVNLAVGLKIKYPSKNVGLLDADIFGPSIPLMMNLHESPLLNNDGLMVPLTNHGVKCMSMGFLIEQDSPVIWRGLMVMQALDKLLRQVAWEDVDYLIVDTPPGTGDTHLSLVQNVPIQGVVIVTTPQAAALQVAKRGIGMYQKLDVPIIGIVENMSWVKCSACSNTINVFGDGTKLMASETNNKILQSFSLHEDMSLCCEKGNPIVVTSPTNLETIKYFKLVEQIVEFITKNKK